PTLLKDGDDVVLMRVERTLTTGEAASRIFIRTELHATAWTDRLPHAATSATYSSKVPGLASTKSHARSDHTSWRSIKASTAESGRPRGNRRDPSSSRGYTCCSGRVNHLSLARSMWVGPIPDHGNEVSASTGAGQRDRSMRQIPWRA